MIDNFDVLNVYFARSPLLNTKFFYEKLKNIKNLEDMITLTSEGKINEGIAIANNDFHELLKENMDNKSSKKRRNIESTLFNYLNRMVFRANPFGLFSSVNLLNFSESDFQIKRKKTKSVLTIDSNWAMELQKIIENNNKYLLKMELIISRRILVEGDRIFLYDNINNGEEQEKFNDLYSIKNSPIIKLIASECREFKPINELIIKIKELNSDVTTEKILAFIKKLIKLEIIYTDLRPSFPVRNHFEEILTFLERNKNTEPNLYSKVLTVKKLVDSYNNIEVGAPKACKILGEIKSAANSIHSYQKIIHVDSSHTGGKLLNKEIKKTANEAINIFSYLCAFEPIFPDNEIILNYFMENYNEREEILIKDLVHLEDFIKYYNDSLYKLQLESAQKIKNTKNYALLKGWINKSIVNKDEELVIDKEHLSELEKNIDLNKIKKIYGLEVPINIHKNKEDTLFVLNSNEINSDIGMYLGRFGYLFEHKSEQLEEVYGAQTNNYNSEYLIPEISAISKRKGANNLGTSIVTRDMNILVNTSGNNNTESLEIDDIVLGMYNGRMYVKSISKNKFLRPKQSNMLVGTRVFSEEYNKLMKMGTDGELTLVPLMDHLFEELNYLPRIRYNNIILSKRKWKFTENMIPVRKKYNSTEFKNSLIDILNIDNNTEVIGIKYKSNNLYYSLENEYHIEQMHNVLKKEKEITIIEAEPSLIVNNDDGSFNEQFVFFAKNKISKKIDPPFSLIDKLSSRKIKYYPWNNWLFFSLYFREERQDEFLTNHLKPFIESIKEDNYDFKWFYIRYKDPSSHIRLRFYTPDKIIKLHLYERLCDFFNSVHRGIPIERITSDSYSPEYMRYGGEDIMPYIEDYFEKESNCCLEIIDAIKDFNVNKKTDLIILYLYDLMESFDLSDKEKIEFLKNNKYNSLKKIPKDIRMKQDERKKLLSNHLKNNQDTVLTNNQKSYFNELNDCLNNSKLITTKEMILSSLMHMFVNRIKKIDLSNENEIMLALKLAISDFYYSNKKTIK